MASTQLALYAKFSDEVRKPLKLNLKSEKKFVVVGRRTLFFAKNGVFRLEMATRLDLL